MPVIQDDEFGEVVVRSHKNSTRISLRVGPDGRLRVSTPSRTPLMIVKMTLKTSRADIRELMNEHNSQRAYTHDQPIGKSHNLVIGQSQKDTTVKTTGTKIFANIATDERIASASVQQSIRKAVQKALRKEAKSYLPRRLAFLAETHGFHYETVRISHASSRWGSCSSSGTISLNISLMQLPFELLDYVLIHELCHTREMNHSKLFWDEVAAIDPEFKKHRQNLKQYTPSI